jgi:asparagine synthase (glutamine-hydrolysing)
LRFDEKGLVIRRWYGLAQEQREIAPGSDDPEAALRERFDAAVRSRLVSDVPVGVFLSSGIDSALVAASVARSGGDLKTFTVGFEGASGYYEERPQAAAVARYLGAEHTEIAVGTADVDAVLDQVFLALDEPFADASAVPSFLVAQATRKKVSVVLTGDGADEIFGGYRRYWSELYAGLWNRAPASLRHAAAALLKRAPEGKDHPLLEGLRRMRRFVMTAENDPARRQAALMRLMEEDEIDALLGPKIDDAVPLEHRVRELRTSANDDDPINAMLACDVALGLPGDMLTKVDRTSMAHALETRTPFLDQRVVELAFSIPGSAKLRLKCGKPIGKHILRTAFEDRLPKKVFHRPKRGFEMPVGAMLTGPASERLAAATSPAALLRQGLFNSPTIAGWKDELVTGRRDTSWQLWTVVAFQEWARLHGRSERIG